MKIVNCKPYLIFPLLSIISCTQYKGELEIKIERNIKSDCMLCTIDISSITSFRWSKFFVFRETCSEEEINRVLKQNYPYFSDVSRRIVFLDEHNKITYHEDTFPNPETIVNGEIVFDIGSNMNYREFSREPFEVMKIINGDKYYYLLNQ
jgi:hypothetical protein